MRSIAAGGAGRWAWTRGASSTIVVGAELDRQALILALELVRVNIVLVDVSTGEELAVAVVRNLAIVGNREATSWAARRVLIALKLVTGIRRMLVTLPSDRILL